MPDSEHPNGGESSEAARRPGDEPTTPARRARTSTTERPARAPRARKTTSSDPRTEGSRTPPRRPKARGASENVDEDVDVAAALARVPDATAAGTPPRNGTATDGGTKSGTTDRRAASGTNGDAAAPAANGATAANGAAAANGRTAESPTEPVFVAGTSGAEDTVVVPVVEAGADAFVETEVIPVVEPRILPAEPEFEPRIYDVEEDEPGAYVALVPAVSEPVEAPTPVEAAPAAVVVAPPPAEPRRRSRRRPRVRRVTRVIRHVDTWTVFKVLGLLNAVIFTAAVISGVLLWNVAHGTGTIDNVERFMESFGWETFEFDGQAIFDAAWRIALFMALGLTGLGVLAATTFNLITDIVGGIRVTVLEEEVVVAPPDPSDRRAETVEPDVTA